MKTPYVPHLFGADALAKVANRVGWLTVGVASSIAWPEDDVWVEYDNAEYLLHGASQEGEHRIAPCISTPADRNQIDEALTRLYRFASVLGYFKRGYVDISHFEGWGALGERRRPWPAQRRDGFSAVVARRTCSAV